MMDGLGWVVGMAICTHPRTNIYMFVVGCWLGICFGSEWFVCMDIVFRGGGEVSWSLIMLALIMALKFDETLRKGGKN